ncbi:MAG: hypothetical protein ABIR54_05585 [Burkholderiaceae bacterium]|jgi:stalled ribosome rescue protein Dom34
MAFAHAAVWIEHHGAHVLQFDSEHVTESTVKEHVHYTRQHGSQVRAEHEFFGEITEALREFKSVLVVGQHAPQAAFRQYISKHRPALALHVVAWKTVDHPTEAEVLKLAREFFVQRGEMAATPRMH